MIAGGRSEDTFDIHDDVTQAAAVADADRIPFADEGSAGDPMRYITATNLANYIQTEAGQSFDIHDDVTQVATIVDSDRLAFADEGSTGDPMRYTTAASLADYLQIEVELNASRVTAGTFGTARIPGLNASQTTAGTFNEARLGTGTASTSNVLKGGSGTTAAWGPVSVDPDDIGATNTPSDGDLPFYDSTSGEVTWQPIGFDTGDWSNYVDPLTPTCPDTVGEFNPGIWRKNSARCSDLTNASQ